MTIRYKTPTDKVIIDCGGPSGTPQALVGQAALWLHEQGQPTMMIGDVLGHMMASDYDNMISVFDKHFGSFCEILR